MVIREGQETGRRFAHERQPTHTMPLRRSRCRQETDTIKVFTRVGRRTRMNCRGPIYMSGKMSRQIVPAKHRSFRIQIRTQRFESNQFIIVSHFVPLIHYRPVHCIVHVLTVISWPFPTLVLSYPPFGNALCCRSLRQHVFAFTCA